MYLGYSVSIQKYSIISRNAFTVHGAKASSALNAAQKSKNF